MKKKYNQIILLCLLSIVLGSCKKYLEIQPEDKYTEDQIFSNESAIQEVLNGLYNSLANNSLYGANLTTTAIETLAQRYNPSGYSDLTIIYSYLQQYNYSDIYSVQPFFDDLWTQAYFTIAQANKFIAKLDEANQNGVISTEKADLLKGEAIGIRALIHFDLLRLFGPIYSTSPDEDAIPYYTKANAKTQPILPASQVMDSILSDLSNAQELLENDPIIVRGIVASEDFYSSYRNQRLNYYAIMALRARVCLYAGNTILAHDLAKEVLDEGENLFPWLNYSIVLEPDNPDRIFSTEVLFGIYNFNMYTNFTNYFSSDLRDDQILSAHPDKLIQVFENNENDYRYTTTWLNSVKGYRIFYKFADIPDQTKPWRFIQPLIRKSELYYILAETETDSEAALNYLNTVRYNRGLIDLTNVSAINTEIQKEYKKEFWGEGQLFFYYKRKNISNIPNGTDGYDWSTVSPVYVVPLPLSETTPR